MKNSPDNPTKIGWFGFEESPFFLFGGSTVSDSSRDGFWGYFFWRVGGTAANSLVNLMHFHGSKLVRSEKTVPKETAKQHFCRLRISESSSDLQENTWARLGWRCFPSQWQWQEKVYLRIS